MANQPKIPNSRNSASLRRKNNPEKQRAADKRWYETHSEQKSAADRRRRLSNPEKARAKDRRYRDNHREKIREHKHRRRADKHSLTATLTKQDWQRALEHFNGCCAYCGKRPDKGVLHQEHFKPLVSGGGYTPDNIVPSCQVCNLRKSKQDPIKWILKHFDNAVLERIETYLASQCEGTDTAATE